MAAKKTIPKTAKPKSVKAATKAAVGDKVKVRKPKAKGTQGGARKTDFIKMIEQSSEEVEEYLLSVHDENVDEFADLPTRKEMEFCLAWTSNGYKLGPAAMQVLEGLTENQARKTARKYLEKHRVQRYLARILHDRRLKLCLTSDWIAKKYMAWATLDITKFLDFKPSKRGRPATVYLRDDINKLPPLIRQSIKAITVDDKKGTVKVEFIDQKTALDSLSKLLGFTNDKLVDVNQHIEMHFDGQDSQA